MANPKYIDESLIPSTKEPEPKKVNKKAYSFRCDERLLAAISEYAEIDGISLPQLLSDLIADFMDGKILTNDFITDYDGSYINIMSKDGRNFEYELIAIPNNLDVWDDGYKSKNPHFKHDGIDFVIIPEAVQTTKLPEMEWPAPYFTHNVDLSKLPECLYCIHIIMYKDGTVAHNKISFMDAINELKAAGRYDLIAKGHEMKKELDHLHSEFITERGRSGVLDSIFYESDFYSRLLNIRNKYNSGAIKDAASGLDNIDVKYALTHVPDTTNIIKQLIDKNNRLNERVNQMEGRFNNMMEAIDKVNDMSDEELWQMVIAEHESNNSDPAEVDDDVDEDAD